MSIPKYMIFYVTISLYIYKYTKDISKFKKTWKKNFNMFSHA